MSEKYKPVNGDRVRVVYEGVVNSADDTGFAFGGKVPVIYDEDKDYLKSIEKIEPPGTVFKPGDVVRHKNGALYSLAHEGYLSHTTGNFHKWYPVGMTRKDFFTSAYYEKVSLG